ncbi:MAG: hypothetical protein M3Y21_11010 [Candidatus Eremiobacteraeota bacterium]|nr:hypothetical protein [Candidatus Eremiobacteraeota bacterium]
MRPHLAISIALSLLAGCASAAQDTASASPEPAPSALAACSSIVATIEGASVAISTNVDGSLARIAVLSTPSARARAAALRDISKRYGAARQDTRFVDRPWHFGFTRRYDLCGNPIQ